MIGLAAAAMSVTLLNKVSSREAGQIKPVCYGHGRHCPAQVCHDVHYASAPLAVRCSPTDPPLHDQPRMRKCVGLFRSVRLCVRLCVCFFVWFFDCFFLVCVFECDSGCCASHESMCTCTLERGVNPSLAAPPKVPKLLSLRWAPQRMLQFSSVVCTATPSLSCSRFKLLKTCALSWLVVCVVCQCGARHSAWLQSALGRRMLLAGGKVCRHYILLSYMLFWLSLRPTAASPSRGRLQ
jgi:hypothetical protein